MYKRQTVGFGGSDEELAHIADEYIEISHLVSACKGYYAIAREAVSYTHLDVYKRQVRCLSEDKKAILLQNHGSVCVDQTVEKALSCAVYLEEGAQIAYLALLAEGLNPIPKEYISIMRESQKKGKAL